MDILTGMKQIQSRIKDIPSRIKNILTRMEDILNRMKSITSRMNNIQDGILNILQRIRFIFINLIISLKKMKTLLVLFSIFGSCFAYGQSLLGKWKIEKVLWNDAQPIYHLTQIPADASAFAHYGNSIAFKADKTFVSNYSAPCGNDCFPSSNGNYRFIGKNQVELVVKEINQSGDCKNIHEKGTWKLGTYLITPTENGLVLKK